MSHTFLTLPPAWAGSRTDRHVVLVGLPGCGKTTVGRAVAEQLGRAFLDLDQEIERREGSDIATIFAEKGEPYFREQERQVTTELAEIGGLIISPGGGWISNGEALSILRPRARVIYLKARPETALSRMGASRTSRPILVRPDPLGELKRLLAERQSAYERADHVIDTERMTAQQVISEVAALATTGGRA
ncbi:MAG: shikimate kinase [Gemmatimonadaceae bacterium]